MPYQRQVAVSPKSSVNERLKAITPDLMILSTKHRTTTRNATRLNTALSLLDAKSKADKAVKRCATCYWIHRCWQHYATLTEDQNQDDLWLKINGSPVSNRRLMAKSQRLTQALTARVQELEERYAEPLPDLAREVETFSAKVDEHLQKMGWE